MLKSQTNPELVFANPTGLSALIRIRGFQSPTNDQAKWIVQDRNCQRQPDYYEETFQLLKRGKNFSKNSNHFPNMNFLKEDSVSQRPSEQALLP
jgi:hypothetical protein